jgi:outer membrane immunogenic protein
MKKVLLGTVALAALGAGMTANAAEIAVPRRAAYVAPVAYTNWTGCHLGGSVGNEWGRNRGYTTTAASSHVQGGFTVFPPTPPATVGTLGSSVGTFPIAIPAGQEMAPGFDMNGFTGGFYGGCDYQAGTWVFGIEGDWSNVNKSGQTFDNTTVDALGLIASTPGFTRTTAIGIGGPFTVTDRYGDVHEMQERWYATLRGRLGYAVDKWLLYATGGVAWARIDSSEFNILLPQIGVVQTDTRVGWTVGAGIEYAVGWGWSVRSEYLYIDIPSYTTFTPGVGAGATLIGFAPGPLLAAPLNFPTAFTAPTNLSTRLNNNVLRFGLTYKFGNYASAAPVTK